MSIIGDIATQVDRELVIEALEKELATYEQLGYFSSERTRGRCEGLLRAIEITREVLQEGR